MVNRSLKTLRILKPQGGRFHCGLRFDCSIVSFIRFHFVSSDFLFTKRGGGLCIQTIFFGVGISLCCGRGRRQMLRKLTIALKHLQRTQCSAALIFCRLQRCCALLHLGIRPQTARLSICKRRTARLGFCVRNSQTFVLFFHLLELRNRFRLILGSLQCSLPCCVSGCLSLRLMRLRLHLSRLILRCFPAMRFSGGCAVEHTSAFRKRLHSRASGSGFTLQCLRRLRRFFGLNE